VLINGAFRLGLTGGMGSGKSTVAALLAETGAIVIDADAISRACTAAGGAAIALIQAHFGVVMITNAGALDREQMRKLVFSDATARSRLEGIIHPIVTREIAQQTSNLERNGARCIVFDIPLLTESGHWRAKLHRILVIDCTTETQLDRISQRNGIRPAEAQNILASQASRQQRANVADMVLFNDNIGIGELTHQLNQIAPQFGL